MARKDYSDAELIMFETIGVDEIMFTMVSPMQLYTIAIIKVFLEDQKGPAIDALRRTMRAIDFGQPRRTMSFDNLIRL